MLPVRHRILLCTLAAVVIGEATALSTLAEQPWGAVLGGGAVVATILIGRPWA